MAGNDAIDFTLLRLDGFLPPGIWFAGWLADEPSLNEAVTAIHHPAGDFKRISFGHITMNNPFSPMLSVIFSTTSTEGGSSGSPLFNANHRVIGQLSRGEECSVSGSRDNYGKLSKSFPFIESYIFPALQSGTPPAAPSDLREAHTVITTTASVFLQWNDNSTDELGFHIERWNGEAWARISSVVENIVTYADIGLPITTDYYYRVQAYNSSGRSDYSNVANAVIDGYDLGITILNVRPPSIGLGDAIEVDYDVLNYTRSTGEFSRHLYLSSNSIISPFDTLI